MPVTSPVRSVQLTPDWFDQQYRRLAGQGHALPWQVGGANTALVNWLNAIAPSTVRCGARVCVVGCGFGDDARELMRRGYDVTAFDCSETAVQQAREHDPANASSYVHADLFSPPLRWRHRFDLVVDANNLSWWSHDQRLAAMSAIADLLSMHGRLLVISDACDTPVSDDDGPPWPLTVQELNEATGLAGLVADEPACTFTDDEDPTQLRLRATFRRA